MTDGPRGHVPGSFGRIPVRNVWLLLLYASAFYRELPESRRVELEKAPDEIPELVAEILADAAERRLRRNLSHGYERRRADLGRVRGRIDFLRTEMRLLQRRGRIACIFDELTVNTPRNRFVRAALERIASVLGRTNGQQSLADHCRRLAIRFDRAGVGGYLGTGPIVSAAARDRAGWLDSHERQMLSTARLAWDLSIPTEQSGPHLVSVPDLSGVQGWRLFELAVTGFYDAALSHRGWSVRHGRHFRWPATDQSQGITGILPRMIPDILLERRTDRDSPDARRIVIDTKFASILGPDWYGKKSIKSPNIYQIYAYLRTQERDNDPLTRDSTGVLLYPSLGVDYFETALIQGHRLIFATVDLAADTSTIRGQLLQIVD